MACCSGRWVLPSHDDHIFDDSPALHARMTAFLGESQPPDQPQAALVPRLHGGPQSRHTRLRAEVVQYRLPERRTMTAPDPCRVHAQADIDQIWILFQPRHSRFDAGAAESDQRTAVGAGHRPIALGVIHRFVLWIRVVDLPRAVVAPSGDLAGVLLRHRPDNQLTGPTIGHTPILPRPYVESAAVVTAVRERFGSDR